jgi:cell division protein ZapA
VKQMEVTILGQSYILSCPEGREADMLAAVAQVDREMSAIRDGGKVKARERIAVLAALNLAFSPIDRSPEHVASPVPRNGSGIDIDGLVRRLDQALGADGQLL